MEPNIKRQPDLTGKTVVKIDFKDLFKKHKVTFNQMPFRQISLLDLNPEEAHILGYFFTNDKNFEVTPYKYCESCFREKNASRVAESFIKLIDLGYLKIVNNKYEIDVLKITEDSKKNFRVMKSKQVAKKNKKCSVNAENNSKMVLTDSNAQVLTDSIENDLTNSKDTILNNSNINNNYTYGSADGARTDDFSEVFESIAEGNAVDEPAGGAATPLYRENENSIEKIPAKTFYNEYFEEAGSKYLYNLYISYPELSKEMDFSEFVEWMVRIDYYREKKAEGIIPTTNQKLQMVYKRFGLTKFNSIRSGLLSNPDYLHRVNWHIELLKLPEPYLYNPAKELD